MERKVKAHRENGVLGLVHGNIGKTPANAKTVSTKNWYIEIYSSKYFDFNFLHAFERIRENEVPPEPVSYSTFVAWLRNKGLGKKKKRRASKARLAREREANMGIMVQMDGSPHQYNGKDKWTLLHMIDDATSTLLESRFYPSETTLACLECLKSLVLTHGVPHFILTDCAGWADKIGKRSSFSQFKRACEQLGIELITTPNPECKGRVERSFRTAQDRLQPEFRLHGIKTLKDGNRYLEQVFKREWNQKYTVSAKDSTTRFRAIPGDVLIEEVFSLQYERIVNRNHTVSFENQSYLLVEPPQNLYKRMITVIKSPSGEITMKYQGQKLASRLMPKYKRNYRTAV